MKQYKAGLLLLILLTGCHALKTNTTKNSKQKQPGTSVELKVMTYNVHHGNPPSKAGIIALDTIAKVIAAGSPDIVFLQEIDDHTSRSGKDINQADALAKRLGMKYCFGKAIDFAGGGYGVAILSRFNLSDQKVYLLPQSDALQSEQRALLMVTAAVGNNLKLTLACSHLDYVSAENRVMQCKKINEILGKDTLPVLLGGDFNDTLHSEAMNIFNHSFRSVCSPCLPTDPADWPKIAIDHILTDRRNNWKVLSYYVGNETYASDHRPVISKLSLQ